MIDQFLSDECVELHVSEETARFDFLPPHFRLHKDEVAMELTPYTHKVIIYKQIKEKEVNKDEL